MKKTPQKICSIFLMILLSSSLLTGCSNSEKTIDYYPNPSASNIDADSDSQDTNEETADTNNSKEDEEELVFDQIRTNGRYVFEQDKLLITAENTMKGDCLEEARMIINAVYNYEEEVVFEGLNYDPNYVKSAITIATYSNPILFTISVEQEEGETYRIIYENDEATQKKLEEDFEEKVTTIINDNIKPEYTDKQRAYAIYKYMVENMTVPYDSTIDKDEDNDAYYAYINGSNREDLMASSFIEGNPSVYEAGFLYIFLLNQLNIECKFVGAMGSYQEQDISLLEFMNGKNDQWPWNVVIINDDEAYHCDLGMDMLKAYDDQVVGTDTPANITYFGMSDASRDKSFKRMFSQDFLVFNAAQSHGIPECNNDMTDYEIK